MSSTTSTQPTKSPTTPPLSLSLPLGAQPDIIRANQKDVYYQSILQEQVSRVCQQFLGARRQHQWQKEINVFSDFCYYGLTTLLGTQTLGEEYCDLVQINQYAETYPRFLRRAILVFVQTLLPYVYTRGITEIKKQSRQQSNLHGGRQLQQQQQQQQQQESVELETTSVPLKERLRQFVQTTLPPWQEFVLKNIRPVHLAVFYFFGAYYNFSKRLTGIRYLFTRQLGPNEQRAGYEVLGALIVVQLMIQAGLELRKRWVQHQEAAAAEAEALVVASVTVDEKDVTDKNQVELLEHDENTTTATIGNSQQQEPAKDDFDFMDAFNDNKEEDESATQQQSEELSYEAMQMLKCALCLEPRKTTTTTPCGHLFCWNCIVEWCQNKPECPLCRSHVNTSHLIPLNNF